MFTFSFGSAFAAPSDAAKQVTADQARAKIEAEYKAAIAALDANMAAKVADKYPGTATTYTYNGITFDKDVYKAVVEAEKYVAAKKVIDNQYDSYCRTLEAYIAHKDFVAFSTEAGGGNAYPQFDINSYKSYTVLAKDGFGIDGNDKLAIAQFKADLAAAEEFIGSIVVAEYSDKKMPGSTDTYREVAGELIADALTALGNIVEPADWSDAVTKIGYVDAIYVPAVGQAKPTGELFVGSVTYPIGLNNLLKVAKEEVAEADLAYAQTETLNSILGSLAAEKAEAVKELQNRIRTEQSKAKADAERIADLNDAIADVNEAYEAAVETITYIVENVETVEALGAISTTSNLFVPAWSFNVGTGNYHSTGWTDAQILAIFKTANVAIAASANEVTQGATPKATLSVADCIARAEIVDAIEKQAAKDKVYVDLDGDFAIEIDAAVEDATYDAYFTGVNTYATPTNNTALLNRVNALIGAAGTQVKVNGKYYDTVNDWYANAGTTSTLNADTFVTVNTVQNDYKKAQFDEIRALVADAKAAIRAAKTIEEADAAFMAAYAEFDAIPTFVEHNAMFTNKTGALKADYDKYIEALDKLATGIEALDLSDTKYDAWLESGDLSTDFITAVENDMKANCFTVEDLAAKYAEYVEILNNLKTEKDFEAEKAAVETQLRALPKVVTVADKAAVEAAREALDAFNDYAVLVGADSAYTIASAAVSILTNAEAAIFADEVEALEDAMEPLAKKYNAGTLTAADKAAVDALSAAIDEFVAAYATKDESNSRLVALENMINQGAVVIDTLEAEMVDIAMADLDDMIAKLAVKDVDAAAVRAAREAFEALSANNQLVYKTTHKEYYDKLVALEKILADDVEAVKITAGSSAKKGSITVKWTVDGNEDAVEAYEIWRSTKKNSGYKKMFTTEKTSYKNTKNLKKGTRYYFKVRAIAYVDDVKIKSDWSNKAYRIAK